MRSFRYLLALLFLPLAAMAVWAGGWWAFSVPIVAFGIVPLLDMLLGRSEDNLGPEEERDALANRIYDAIVYLVVPLHYAVFLFYLYRISTAEMDLVWLAGATWSVGIAAGTYGINVAHELGHRKRPFERFLAHALLLTAQYLHFFIEHNRGHHRRVATPDDPASARYGESVYRFWLRSVVFSYLSAWEIENDRLRRSGKRVFSLENHMVRYQIIQLAALAAVWWVFGLKAASAYLVVALLGILLLETINYLEHYGLTRRRSETGRYEYVLPVHSWNSDFRFGRTLLFELTRHSDHHAHAGRKYQVLRHHDESPELPAGYPAMMLLALVPPLWFGVMHREIERFQARQAV